jgi:CMP-N-acetylneuraminic acid synthetase
MKICTITLMRKGSKRFPNKMMAEFCGKPLYEFTVAYALELGYPYYLLHDYEHIQEKNGMVVINREKKYSGSEHKTCQEINSLGLDYDIYIFLQATNPIRDIALLKKWINIFITSENALCGFSAKRYDNKYIYDDWAKTLNFVKQDRTDNGCQRGSVNIETGNFYIFNKKMLKEKHILASDKIIMFDDPYLFDIDTEYDLKEAERFLIGGEN